MYHSIVLRSAIWFGHSDVEGRRGCLPENPIPRPLHYLLLTLVPRYFVHLHSYVITDVTYLRDASLTPRV
jgi:hypothetical protein